MMYWRDIIVHPQNTIREAMQVIDSSGYKMTLVVENNLKLVGILTDGDVRRGLLKGCSLDDKVNNVMKSNPHTVREGVDRTTVLVIMRNLGLHNIPVVNSDGTLVGLKFVGDLFLPKVREELVVVMAGGMGTRLNELTREVPKPMLNVGNKPLLETILNNFSEQGFKKFYLAVNYKSEQIEGYFGDGSNLGLEINYLKESKRMGTAGALSLLPDKLMNPLLVINADLLTNVDFAQMMDLHIATNADVTVGVRDYEMQVPFGVIEESKGRLLNIKEKPSYAFKIGAGINILSPKVLNLVPKDSFFDMPSLLDMVIQQGMDTRTHEINGYWLDIGRLDDYKKANLDIPRVFN